MAHITTNPTFIQLLHYSCMGACLHTFVPLILRYWTMRPAMCRQQCAAYEKQGSQDTESCQQQHRMCSSVWNDAQVHRHIAWYKTSLQFESVITHLMFQEQKSKEEEEKVLSKACSVATFSRGGQEGPSIIGDDGILCHFLFTALCSQMRWWGGVQELCKGRTKE